MHDGDHQEPAPASRRPTRESPMRGAPPFGSSMSPRWMCGIQPTLSRTWTMDEPRSAMCVQNVDVHVSCSSHSDTQLAAFFIDPRAK